jgi:hypothetical protein
MASLLPDSSGTACALPAPIRSVSIRLTLSMPFATYFSSSDFRKAVLAKEKGGKNSTLFPPPENSCLLPNDHNFLRLVDANVILEGLWEAEASI